MHYYSRKLQNIIWFSSLCLLSLLTTCQTSQPEKVDLIVHNALIYTVNEAFEKAEAFAVRQGRFVAIGSNEEILNKYQAQITLDAQGKALYPGFTDAHCHFLGYGQTLRRVNLVGTRSYEEILERLQAFRKENPKQPWLLGRGWDQNDWGEDQAFPDRAPLDSLFPDVPVFLERVDGHAGLVNQKALEIAELSAEETEVEGGKIEVKDGRLTGILVDRASGLVEQHIPEDGEKEIAQALLAAQKNCFAVGLTSVHDAGLGQQAIEIIRRLQKAGSLKMRMYVMISNTAANREFFLRRGPVKDERLHIGAFKVYADGALGSRGACLLKPYADQPSETGFLLASPDSLAIWIKAMYEGGFQVNTHCIGDSANRLLLDIYGKLLKGGNDRRWRIEHAQVVSPEDLEKFGKFQVIPSVQPTHATSDMYWADERLGDERMKGAYAFKDLYVQNGMLALGSDFPVEDINPLYGFYAAVARQDAEQFPEDGFQVKNALSREEALKGMTIQAAYAAFEEEEKGSIEVGKFADFVILQDDIMTIPLSKARETKVWQTFVNGESVYKNGK